MHLGKSHLVTRWCTPCRSEEGPGRKVAGLGLAAILLSAQPQIALAVSLPGTTQVWLSAMTHGAGTTRWNMPYEHSKVDDLKLRMQGDLLTDLLEKNSKGDCPFLWIAGARIMMDCMTMM